MFVRKKVQETFVRKKVQETYVRKKVQETLTYQQTLIVQGVMNKFIDNVKLILTNNSFKHLDIFQWNNVQSDEAGIKVPCFY